MAKSFMVEGSDVSEEEFRAAIARTNPEGRETLAKAIKRLITEFTRRSNLAHTNSLGFADKDTPACVERLTKAKVWSAAANELQALLKTTE